MEFRLKQKYGDWVWDERTKYYWYVLGYLFSCIRKYVPLMLIFLSFFLSSPFKYAHNNRHGMSSTYFDPKSRMFFDNITKQWSRNCPENAPSGTNTTGLVLSTVQPTGVSPAAASGLKKPISSNDNNNNNKDAYSEAQKAGAAAIASAGLSQKVALLGDVSTCKS